MKPRISTFPMGPLETNGYLVHLDGAAVAVDPGGTPRPMLQYAEKNKLTLTHILITHLHFDHIYGAAALAEASGAPVLAGAADAFLMETELGRGGAFGFPRVAPFSYRPVEEGDLDLGALACRVLATPGHTPGSLSFHFPQAGAVIVATCCSTGPSAARTFPAATWTPCAARWWRRSSPCPTTRWSTRAMGRRPPWARRN